MTDFVDGYCERLVPGFWDEPLNAITNIAFIIAALWLIRLARQAGTLGRPTFYIPMLWLALTGVGSFLFHTLANGWSGVADVLALALCLLATIHAAAIRFLGQKWYVALLWPIGMLVAAFLFGAYLPVPGSFYFGPLAAGAVFALTLMRIGHPAGRWIGTAVLVFLPSFFFRTIDGPVCDSFHYGTHFLWHILNGIVLGLAIRPLAWGDDRGVETDGAGRAAG